MKVTAFIALIALLPAAPALAGDQDGYSVHGAYGSAYGQSEYSQGYQTYGHDSRHGQGGPYGRRFDDSYGGQQDVPGDYRCDAYWDRGRSDCNANWRDQRSYGANPGYGHSNYGRGSSQTYYSSQSGRGYGRGATYYGAYGQPDVVYAVPTGGYGPSHGGYGQGGGGYGHDSHGGRNQGRVEWCRATYRSYDPRSGYYRAYSGRLVYCG